MPYQIIYSSQATTPMTVSDLEKILVDARTGNEARDVTGVLIYVDGVFLQILEGDRDNVISLMSAIADDSRHTAVKVFFEAEVNQRMFGSWRMAFLDATPEQLRIWIGLPGTATIESIVEDLNRHPERGSEFAASLLKALAE